MTRKMPYLIVVGLDYSEVSRLALRQALELAAEHPASEVHVIHVQIKSTPLAPDSPAASSADADDADGATTEAWAQTLPSSSAAARRLQSLVAEDVAAFQATRTEPGGAPIARVVAHIRSHAPRREIAQLAADLQADLVVVGTHGHFGVARFLLGSVAHAVVTLAPCPVLVVRAKQVSVAPVIEPPCPRCLEARQRSGGRELWCDQHRARQGQRHTYYQDDRAGQETNFPLVFDER